MAQTEFERGFIAGVNWMSMRGVKVLADVAMSATAETEPQQGKEAQ